MCTAYQYKSKFYQDDHQYWKSWVYSLSSMFATFFPRNSPARDSFDLSLPQQGFLFSTKYWHILSSARSGKVVYPQRSLMIECSFRTDVLSLSRVCSPAERSCSFPSQGFWLRISFIPRWCRFFEISYSRVYFPSRSVLFEVSHFPSGLALWKFLG